MEDWVYIDGSNERYSISSSGLIYKEPSGEPKRLFSRSHSDTVMVELTISGVKRVFSVAKLVMRHFSDRYDPNQLVNHRDGDPTNNHISNLYYRDRHTTTRNLRRWPMAHKVQIVETGEVFPSAREAAEAIGGHTSLVYRCLRREQDTHMGYHFILYNPPIIMYNDRKF